MSSNPIAEMRRTQNQAQSQAHAQRHTACNMCRDKKVRCDGEQPSCSKCRQSGEECVYVPVPTPTRATLANMVKELQDRLERAEARLPTTIQPQQQHRHSSISLPNLLSSLSNYDAPNSYDLNMSPTVPFTSVSMGPPQLAVAQVSDPTRSPLTAFDSGGHCYDSTGFQMLLGDPQHAASEDGMDLEIVERGSGPRHSDLPSISELRSTAGERRAARNPSAPGSSNGPPSVQRAVEELVLSVSAQQAETSCLLGAVAEYLAWVIELPDTGRRSVEVLKILETRLHEMRGIRMPGCANPTGICAPRSKGRTRTGTRP
ncbi:hypothetical protein PG999_007359 [Apiospora kogelbergensis]|uniref:Zn(2)-C6 fungal-type domain-containing protein n=1 Tax=Apiospora kogelbergensis TaxID=1337665 RepID=A0AAW0QY56_9PEZI